MSTYRRAHRFQNANAPSRIASVAAEVFADFPALVAEITATAYGLPVGLPPAPPASREGSDPAAFRVIHTAQRRSVVVTVATSTGATVSAWRVPYGSANEAALEAWRERESVSMSSLQTITPEQFAALGRILEGCEVKP